MATRSNIVVLVCAMVAFGAVGHTQQPPAAPPPQPAPAPAPQPPPAAAARIVPLKVDIVLVKSQGDRTVSRTPYALSVNTGGKASVRMGAEVPVVTSVGRPTPPPDGVPGPPVSFQYRNVGTNIDCFAQQAEDGLFRISVTIEDTSVYPAGADIPPAVAGAPTLRAFKASNDLLLRDGQTSEFVAATDKVSGEVIKAEVKLTVIK